MELRIVFYLLTVAMVTCGESIRVDNKVETAPESDIAPPDNSKAEYDSYTTSETPEHAIVHQTPPPIPEPAPITHKTTKKPAPQNDLDEPQYSRILHDVYKTSQTDAPPTVYTAPPVVPFRTHPLRAIDYKKPVAIKPAPRTPVIPRTANEADEPTDSHTQTFSVPKSVVQTFSQDPNSDLIDNIQPQPITSSYLPPIAVYNQYPYVIPGGYPVPAYPRLSYPRVYNVAPIPYRTLGYSPPLAYPVSSQQNFAYGFPSPSRLQVVYNSPSTGFGDGLAPIQYNSFVGGDYDDFLKKKKRK